MNPAFFHPNITPHISEPLPPLDVWLDFPRGPNHWEPGRAVANFAHGKVGFRQDKTDHLADNNRDLAT